MLNETLEQLKIKPIPKKPQQFQVILQIPSDGIGPNIIDKTSERLINREQFFNELQENLGVVQKDYFKSKKQDLAKNKSSLNEGIFHKSPLDTQGLKSSSALDSKAKIIDIASTLTNIVKTKERIIIKEPSTETLKKSKTQLPSKERLTPKPGTAKDIIPEPIQNLDKRKSKKLHGETIDETLIIPKDLRIGKTLYTNRIPKLEPNVLIKAPNYFLYNR